MSWKEVAKRLPVGQKTRADCTCGTGNTLAINHSIQGIHCFCYRCGRNEGERAGILTLAELKAIQDLNAQHSEGVELKLPQDFTKDIPQAGRLWLFKAGITEPVYKSYGVGYSKMWNRVIIPVYNENKLVWFQARALNKEQKPKYLQPSADRANILFKTHSYSDNTERVVITEDMLSAIRVGKHIPCASLLGTKITTEQAHQLMKFKTVTIWLDPDLAGTQGTGKIRKTLSLVTDVTTITSEEDPKMLTDKQIKDKLWN